MNNKALSAVLRWVSAKCRWFVLLRRKRSARVIERVRDTPHPEKPLMIVGFPRGFTSDAYKIIQKATGLREVFGVGGDGEIFNIDRISKIFFGINEPAFNYNNLLPYDEQDSGYIIVRNILDGLFAPESSGFIIKDVVQPFHIARYLRESPDKFNVIYVKRNLEHVKFSLGWQNWGRHLGERWKRYVKNMEQVEQEFLRYNILDVDQIMADEGYIFRWLSEAFRYDVTVFHFHTKEFIAKRNAFHLAFAKNKTDSVESIAIDGEDIPIMIPGVVYNTYYGATGWAYLYRGWSGPETEYTWTDGPAATIRFAVRQGEIAEPTLVLKTHAYTPDGSFPIDIFIEVEDMTILDMQMPQSEEIVSLRAKLPARSYATGIVECVLRIRNPRKPADYIETIDDRQLGLAIHEISLEC
jgi:hypothetical protein